MDVHLADAHPTKDLFLKMLTRDISLEECIMDFVDNSIDSLIRTRGIDVSDTILVPAKPLTERQRQALPVIEITINEKKFEIVDRCGGISREQALHDVFVFGHEHAPRGSRLGAYGIGLKRAMFKIGKDICIQSRTPGEGFEAHIEVQKWAKKDDWKIPLNFIEGSHSPTEAGTTITIKKLYEEVSMRLASGILIRALKNTLARTYSTFLDRYVRVKLNGLTVEPSLIPIGESIQVKPAKEKFSRSLKDGKVVVTLTASLSPSGDGKWKSEAAGWYVLCNGRVIVAANRDSRTGWGEGIPYFHSKYAKFVGIAFFYSDNPELLPWTTTKHDLNLESEVFQEAKVRMSAVAKPITSFLSKQYPSDVLEEPYAREIAEGVKPADMKRMVSRRDAPFEVKGMGKKVKATVRVQYDAETADIAKVKKRLGEPSFSAGQVGLHTFEHFIKTECPD